MQTTEDGRDFRERVAMEQALDTVALLVEPEGGEPCLVRLRLATAAQPNPQAFPGPPVRRKSPANRRAVSEPTGPSPMAVRRRESSEPYSTQRQCPGDYELIARRSSLRAAVFPQVLYFSLFFLLTWPGKHEKSDAETVSVGFMKPLCR